MPPNHESVDSFLKRNYNNNVIRADMFQVYRNSSENDLCIGHKPYNIVYQRRHGSRDFVIEGNVKTGLYIKPIIVRPGIDGLRWNPGNHTLIDSCRSNLRISDEMFIGGHWAMADVNIAIERRVNNRKNRQSKNNILKAYNVHQYDVTPDSIREECERHTDDPLVF